MVSRFRIVWPVAIQQVVLILFIQSDMRGRGGSRKFGSCFYYRLPGFVGCVHWVKVMFFAHEQFIAWILLTFLLSTDICCTRQRSLTREKFHSFSDSVGRICREIGQMAAPTYIFTLYLLILVILICFGAIRQWKACMQRFIFIVSLCTRAACAMSPISLFTSPTYENDYKFAYICLLRLLTLVVFELAKWHSGMLTTLARRKKK